MKQGYRIHTFEKNHQDFQHVEKVPYVQATGMKTRIHNLHILRNNPAKGNCYSGSRYQMRNKIAGPGYKKHPVCVVLTPMNK